jgi:hypothetical protein
MRRGGGEARNLLVINDLQRIAFFLYLFSCAFVERWYITLMQTKEEIERQITLLEKEIKDLERDLKSYDIKEGDLVMVVAKKEWSNYVNVVRVDSVSSMTMGGRSLDSSGYTCPASYSFDKNVFIKITI